MVSMQSIVNKALEMRREIDRKPDKRYNNNNNNPRTGGCRRHSRYLQISRSKLNHDGSITFQLMAAHNSFILLSAARNISSEKFYEIGLGVSHGYNYAILRKLQEEKQSVQEPSLLSETDFKVFWISWKSGRVAVGRGSVINNGIFLDWTDSGPFEVNGIGVMSAWRSSATWLFESEDIDTSTASNGQITEDFDNRCIDVCDCQSQDKKITLSSEDVKAIKMETDKMLRIDKRKTALYKGKKICAEDNRVSSVSIGFVGWAVILFVVAFIVFLDFVPNPAQNKRKFKR